MPDFRPNTKKEYVRYLCKLAEHFQCDPATLSEDQVREYFLFLRQHQHYGGSAMTVARASLRCFYVDCRKRTDWTVFQELAIRRVEPLPVDTVGAGDCFTAWLAVGVAEKLPLEQAVTRANRAAAIAVTRHGAQAGMPWRREVR